MSEKIFFSFLKFFFKFKTKEDLEKDLWSLAKQKERILDEINLVRKAERDGQIGSVSQSDLRENRKTLDYYNGRIKKIERKLNQTWRS